MFLHFIHQFRAIAIIFIVAGHSDNILYWEDGSLAHRLVTTIFANGTLLFVFIAGFLFQYLLPRYSHLKYYKSKLYNVIIPYVLISIPAVAYFVTNKYPYPFLPEGFFEFSMAYQVYWLYITGLHLTAMWFIPMITLFYLLGPVFAALDRDGRVYYLVPPLFVLSLFLHRSYANLDIIHSFIFFLPIYLLGMWTSRNLSLVMKIMERVHIPAALIWVSLVVIQFFFFKAAGNVYVKEAFSFESDIISVNMIQKTVLAFLLVYYLSRLQDRIGTSLDAIATTSFAIYFLHSYVIKFTSSMLTKLDLAIAGNFITFIFACAAVLGVSLWVALMTKRIFPNRSRILIGA